MKKQEFITELKTALAPVAAHVRDEIIADISEHFTEAIAQGLSEEEVCHNLGQPGAIAAQVMEEYGQAAKKEPHESGYAYSYNTAGHGSQTPPHATKVKGGYEIDIDKVFTGIHDINVSLHESKLRFVPSSDNTFRVTIKGQSKHEHFTADNVDGRLMVVEFKEGGFFKFDFFRFKSTLVTTVYVPAQYAGKIRARTSVGNISANNISGQLDLKSAAGNVNVEEHHCGKARIRSAAGNISAQLISQRVDDVDISTAAGNAKLTANDVGRLQLSSSAGNVTASITRLSGDAKINTAAGTVDVTMYDAAGNINVSTGAGSATVRLPADVNMRINASKPGVGSLHNELRGNPNSPYTLKASSGVGSVRLKAL